MTHNHYS